MKTVIFDCNIYDKLAVDSEHRCLVAESITQGDIRVIATPVVVGELVKSPFAGVPSWFPVDILMENVAVVGFARAGMARVGKGEVYSGHRGRSNKIKDAILAESADGLADILVTEDARCRRRLAAISSKCRAMTYTEFVTWLEGDSSKGAT